MATLSFGYADGVPRDICKGGWVEIHGKRAPIIGLANMDQCMADLRGIPGVKLGDSVTIFTSEEHHPANLYDLSNLLKTNKNELLARIGRRVPRVYLQNGRRFMMCEGLSGLEGPLGITAEVDA
jgi:alanine racemase